MVSRHNARSCVRLVSQVIGVLGPPPGAVKIKILCSRAWPLQLWPFSLLARWTHPVSTLCLQTQ